MSKKNFEQAVHIVRCFVEQYYSEASLVLLCGSWARHCAHQDSDIDLFIVDSKMEKILFEGLIFETWLIEVCALSPQHIQELFAASMRNRSAPVPRQVVDGLVIVGTLSDAEQVKATARSILSEGPSALNEAEKLNLRWSLTAILNDLAHAIEDEIPSLAAQCHTQFAQAAIDTVRGWRGDRKTLRRLLSESEPELVAPLDDALRAAIDGNRKPMLAIGYQILEKLGGSQRTYLEWY